MRGLERRINRLAKKVGCPDESRFFVVILQPGETEADALQREGLAPSENDDVLYVSFVSPPAEGPKSPH